MTAPDQGEKPMLPTGEHKPELLNMVQQVLDFVADRPFDDELEFQLNRRFGPYGPFYDRLAKLLKAGLAEGWAAYTPIEGAGYSRGRIAEVSPETRGMRVESAIMRDVVGQYHCHTRGEIDMVVPIDEGALWCGHGAGWVVYPPGSEHFPTTTGGQAAMLFFLPNGEIEYKSPPADLVADDLNDL
jgi:hypothetical protein